MTFAQIQSRAYQLSDSNSTAFPVANLTLSLLAAMDRVVSLINRVKYGWEWDDSNQTDLPIGKTTITSGQHDYGIATAHLAISRVEVKDSAANWHLLNPIDQQLLKRDRATALAMGESSRTGAYQATTGIPTEYDLLGNSIFLYPIPNYTQASSLFVYFARGAKHFDYATGAFTDATGSTASSPGINSLYHDLLAHWCAYDYCKIYKPNLAQPLFITIQMLEREMEEDYGSRDRDTRHRLTVSTDSNK